jgi:predicted Zn-ribbon and HTH transcriptional regulator
MNKINKIIAMLKEREIRSKILRRVEKISTDKLDDIWEFLRKIEKNSSKKNDILSYAGCWKDFDKNLIDDLTINLGTKRLEEDRGGI